MINGAGRLRFSKLVIFEECVAGMRSVVVSVFSNGFWGVGLVAFVLGSAQLSTQFKEAMAFHTPGLGSQVLLPTYGPTAKFVADSLYLYAQAMAL